MSEPQTVKRSPYFWYDVWVNGIRRRGATPILNKEELRQKAKRWIEAKKVSLLTDSHDEVRAKADGELLTILDDYMDAKCEDDAAGKARRKTLGTARKYLTEVRHPRIRFMREINNDVIEGLVAWRKKQPKWDRVPAKLPANATINRMLSAIQSVFSWAKEIKEMKFPNEPNWGKRKLSEPRERPRELTDAEESALVATFDDPDYLRWMYFALFTGMRLENTLLRWDDVNLDTNQIHTVGKRGARVDVPLIPGAVEIISECIGHHPEFIFTFTAERARDGRVVGERYPLTYSGIKTYWRRRRAEAAVICPSLLALGKTFRIHDFRHTCGTRLLRETGNLKLVQVTLGHSNLATTGRYAHVSNEEVRAGLSAVALRHPRRTIASAADEQDSREYPHRSRA